VKITAVPQPPDPAVVALAPWVRIDKTITPPVVVKRTEPEYPEDDRRWRISGIVILQIAIADTGAVGDIRILKSLAPDFDMSAIAAVRQWEFRPAMRDGKTVPVLFNLTINFKLK
jgi:protein TonB